MYYMPFGSLFIVCSSVLGPLVVCCLCSCAFLSVRRRGYYLWDFFWYFPTFYIYGVGHATSTNNETYFYGENRLIRNEMISIKMFSLLVAIQLSLFLVYKRFKVKKNVTHAKNVLLKAKSIPFEFVCSFFIFHFGKSTSASKTTKNEKATQNAVALLIGPYSHRTLHIHILYSRTFRIWSKNITAKIARINIEFMFIASKNLFVFFVLNFFFSCAIRNKAKKIREIILQWITLLLIDSSFLYCWILAITVE